jgi:hypothetical protein
MPEVHHLVYLKPHPPNVGTINLAEIVVIYLSCKTTFDDEETSQLIIQKCTQKFEAEI